MMKKICNILSTVILVVMLVAACLLIVPPLIGFHSLAVLSGSMEPNIGVGSIVYAKETEEADLKVGDVITYKLGGSTLVTHRIIEMDEENRQVITQGDANDVADTAPVSYDQIVGRVVFHAPLLGYASIYLKTPIGIAAACGVLFVMILLNFLPDILSGEKEEKNKKDKK